MRHRPALVAAAVVVCGAGLVVRFALPEELGDLAGGALYAVLVYLLVVVIGVRLRIPIAAAIATLVCWGIELLQVTALPDRLAEALPPSRLVLGTTFSPVDLVSATAGVLAGVLLDLLLARRFLRGRMAASPPGTR